MTDLTYDEMIAKAESLEKFARGCRREGIIQGPEGAEDAEQAALDWRRAAATLLFEQSVEPHVDNEGHELHE